MLDEHLLRLLACPKDRTPLSETDDRTLSCVNGHRFPIVGDVPVLLRDDKEQTMGLAYRSLAAAAEYAGGPAREDIESELFLDSLGCSEEQKEVARKLAASSSSIDPVVSVIIGATSGYAYEHLVGKLEDYPIPDIRLEEGRGRTLLDIGSNWGRWSIAAARKGYRVVGIDPSLSAVMAGKRTARRLGLAIDFVCGDARSLPFGHGSFDVTYSYSVLQHFSKSEAQQSINEAARVLKPGGKCLIQMAHAIGIRSLYHQARRRFREARAFEVRYWMIPELRRAFSKEFTTSDVSVHCYFGLGLEPSDINMLPRRVATIVRTSEQLRRWSHRFPFLKYFADSVFVLARKS